MLSPFKGFVGWEPATILRAEVGAAQQSAPAGRDEDRAGALLLPRGARGREALADSLEPFLLPQRFEVCV